MLVGSLIVLVGMTSIVLLAVLALAGRGQANCARMERLRANGATYAQIAAAVSMSPSSVWYQLNSGGAAQSRRAASGAGGQHPRKRLVKVASAASATAVASALSAAQVEQVVRLRNVEGYTLQQLVDAVHQPAHVVWAILSSNNLTQTV